MDLQTILNFRPGHKSRYLPVRYTLESMSASETTRPPAYAILLRTRNRAADIALAGVIEQMEPEYQQMALSVLLARGYEPALVKLVVGWKEADDYLRHMLATQTDALAAGVRVCIADEHFEVRESALALIRESRNCKLAYLVGEALTHSCRKTVELAAQTLLSLVDQAQEHAGRHIVYSLSRESHPKTEMDHLAGAIRRGLASWPLHFRGEVITAAAWLSRYLEDSILRMANDSRSKVARAFNNLVNRMPDPRFAGYCLRALRSPQLSEAAAEFIGTSESAKFRELLLDEAWLLADEGVQRSCIKVRKIECLQDAEQIIDSSNPARCRSAIKLLAACGSKQGAKVSQLMQLAFCEDEAASRAAIWCLIENPLEGTEQALKAVASRSDSSMSLLAQLELNRRGNAPLGLDLPGGYEKRVPVAHDAQTSMEITTFSPYWQDYDSIPTSDRASIGRIVMENTIDFVPQLRRKWHDSDSQQRLRVLKIIRDLQLVREFEEELHEAANDKDSVVRSMSIPMLGILGTKASRRVLRAALNEPDDRVQANAIEALDELEWPEKQEQIEPKIHAQNNRVKANAVKAMLRLGVREAAEELLAMLESDAVEQRVSALWVVERLQLVAVADRLRAMAEEDPDSRVMRRARRVLDTVADRTPGSGQEQEQTEEASI